MGKTVTNPRPPSQRGQGRKALRPEGGEGFVVTYRVTAEQRAKARRIGPKAYREWLDKVEEPLD